MDKGSWQATAYGITELGMTEVTQQSTKHRTYILATVLWRKIEKTSRVDGTAADLFQILKDDDVKVLFSICQQIWRIQQWSQDWKKSIFISISKKGNAKECSNC